MTTYADISGGLKNYTSYTTLITQNSDASANNVYFFDDGADVSGYVFELTSFDESTEHLIAPSFEREIQEGLGFADVSAVAEIDISLSYFPTLFSIEIDSDDLTDICANDIKYGFGVSAENIFSLGSSTGVGAANILISDANVKAGMRNSTYSDQSIEFDFVRDLAYQITGGYAAADIFTNEAAVRTGVKDLDAGLQTSYNTLINALITDTNGAGFGDASAQHAFLNEEEITALGDTDAATNSVSAYRAAIALFMINSNSGQDGKDSARLTQLLADIAVAGADGSGNFNDNYLYPVGHASAGTQVPNDGRLCVPLKFHVGDKVALRVTYTNSNTNPIGNNVIASRTYKVLINLVTG